MAKGLSVIFLLPVKSPRKVLSFCSGTIEFQFVSSLVLMVTFFRGGMTTTSLVLENSFASIMMLPLADEPGVQVFLKFIIAIKPARRANMVTTNIFFLCFFICTSFLFYMIVLML